MHWGGSRILGPPLQPSGIRHVALTTHPRLGFAIISVSPSESRAKVLTLWALQALWRRVSKIRFMWSPEFYRLFGENLGAENNSYLSSSSFLCFSTPSWQKSVATSGKGWEWVGFGLMGLSLLIVWSSPKFQHTSSTRHWCLAEIISACIWLDQPTGLISLCHLMLRLFHLLLESMSPACWLAWKTCWLASRVFCFWSNLKQCACCQNFNNTHRSGASTFKDFAPFCLIC